MELRKPLILMMPIPGVEDYNASFFEEHQMALKANNTEELVIKTKWLLENKNMQEELVRHQREYIHPYSAKALVDFVLERLKKS